MVQRIIEIIIYVISELKSKKQFDEIDLEKLKNLGYTNSEISTAFSWIADNGSFGDILDTKPQFNNGSKYFRILNPIEKDFFTENAANELIHYNVLGLLSNENIEQLLDKNLLHGYTKIDSNELKMFLANVVLDVYQKNYNANKILLSGNESIN